MKNHQTEKELVAGCIRNDRRSQEAFYRKYFPVMLRMVGRYTQDQDEAISILNDGFLRVFKKLDTFSFNGSLEGWVRRLVFNALSDYYRKANRSMRFLVFEDRDKKTDDSVLNDLYFEDLLGYVGQLPDATQRVFHLYAIEGFKHKEIAAMLKISEGTSKWHLSSARKQLQSILNKHNNQHYAG